jgi:predicted MFS family arabinose efflux permease
MLPVALALVTAGLLFFGRNVGAVALLMIVWGAINSAIPVAWSAWLAREISDQPESGGGLMVAVIQLSIMSGAALGGWLLDHWTISAPFIGSVLFLTCAAVIVNRREFLLNLVRRTDELGSAMHRKTIG